MSNKNGAILPNKYTTKFYNNKATKIFKPLIHIKSNDQAQKEINIYQEFNKIQNGIQNKNYYFKQSTAYQQLYALNTIQRKIEDYNLKPSIIYNINTNETNKSQLETKFTTITNNKKRNSRDSIFNNKKLLSKTRNESNSIKSCINIHKYDKAKKNTINKKNLIKKIINSYNKFYFNKNYN